jgi:hypothetical protein
MERNAFATPVFDSAPDSRIGTSAAYRRRTLPAELPAASRHDLYRNIHGALRLCMGDALAAVGRMDADDPADVAAVTLRMNELLALFRAHLEKEDTFVHPALEARQPGATTRIAHDHAEHLAGFARLAADVQALREGSTPKRRAAARTLHRDLAAFVAANLVHMAAEESDHNAVLWSTHTDAELIALEQSIVASVAPALRSASLRWMVPAIPHADRVALLSALREAAPAEAFDAALAMLMPHLSQRDWAKLMAALRSGPEGGN